MGELTPFLQHHADFPVFWDFFSDTLGPLGWWIGLQLVLLFLGTRRGLRLVWVFLLAALANSVLKWLWAEPRPYWASDSVQALRATAGFGMPSGHAQVATAFWGGMAWLVGVRWVWVLAVLIVFFTGVSRVYYGVHSPAQVLVGWTLGIALTSWLLWRLPRIEAFFRRQVLTRQIGFGIVIWLVAAALMGGVYLLRADFVAPTDWVERFLAAQALFGTARSGPGQMHLVEASTFLLLIPLLGYGGLALLTHRRGHYCVIGGRAKLLAFVAALAINLGAIALLWSAEAPQWLVAGWLLVQPVVAVWWPLRLVGQPEAPVAVSTSTSAA